MHTQDHFECMVDMTARAALIAGGAILGAQAIGISLPFQVPDGARKILFVAIALAALKLGLAPHFYAPAAGPLAIPVSLLAPTSPVARSEFPPTEMARARLTGLMPGARVVYWRAHPPGALGAHEAFTTVDPEFAGVAQADGDGVALLDLPGSLEADSRTNSKTSAKTKCGGEVMYVHYRVGEVPGVLSEVRSAAVHAM